MKNAHQILSSLKNKPEFSKLNSVECIEKLQTLFTLPLQRMIQYGYIKNSTLYFVLNHSGAKQEFDNTLASIKDALKIMASECDNVEFEHIKAYAIFKPQEPLDPHTPQQMQYYELSHAAFTNTQEDKELYKSFENIRNIIKEQ